MHPSLVLVEDIQGVKAPLSILGAEIDHMSPPEVVKQFEAALNAKPEVDSFVKIFQGCSHGWSVRYKDEDEGAVKSAEEAHREMLEWFIKHLKLICITTLAYFRALSLSLRCSLLLSISSEFIMLGAIYCCNLRC